MTSMTARPCPICGIGDVDLLFSQQFSPIDGASLCSGYDVVVCHACGFGFADGIPPQEVFDTYYRDMSKYENHQRDGEESPADLSRFEGYAAEIKRHLPSRSARILELGSATGKLLYLLKEAGYPDPVGLDPSPACSEAAGRLYGVQVLTGVLADLASLGESFDFIIGMEILEHVRELSQSLKIIRDRLEPGGLLYVDVPDATRFADFPDSPFQQFSTEHINFFSRESLANLLQASGFETVHLADDLQDQSDTTKMPVVTGLFRKVDRSPPRPTPDERTRPTLEAYISNSRGVDEHLHKTILDLVVSGEPIIVWGVGTHTQRLLATSRLPDARIVAFVDSNQRYRGKALNGRPIHGPDDIRGLPHRILVSSRVFQREIARQIREGHGFSHELILLYQDCDFD